MRPDFKFRTWDNQKIGLGVLNKLGLGVLKIGLGVLDIVGLGVLNRTWGPQYFRTWGPQQDLGSSTF